MIADDWEAWSESPEADDAPYLVHAAGPDDILPARTWREAVAVAHALNDGVVAYTDRTEHDGLVRSWATPYLRSDAESAGVVLGVVLRRVANATVVASDDRGRQGPRRG